MKTVILTLCFALALGTDLYSESIQLSLKEALILALDNNRDIKIERINIDRSKGEITSQKGLFDPLLSIESSYSEFQTPTASTFIESGTINEDEFNINAGIGGRLPTGTFYRSD